ncbi:peptidase C39 [Scytonema hofmannii PCC 7110]|uniref:Peptidase C39 n=1 Tax=Scytonema hofmannii PCC 7110 TaxID=128403 RepID=A0A139WZ02_9CYAN|nr:ABC transporter transmembrane domain-containing protein [Scytonema hofmannii]KYC37684.1 peptidase C39 [Scytonema hofmannii PCC 7110]
MNSFSSFRVQKSIDTSQHLSPMSSTVILNCLKLITGDSSLVLDFSKIWVVREFQLGDDLIIGSPDKTSENTSDFLYLVCQGRVRLLGYDKTLKRSVSTQLLLPQQTFGADCLFFDEPLPYQATAASAGYVAQVKVSDVVPWLQHFPNLETNLKHFTHERQALIFFKTCTELRSQKSHNLQQLLPYLEQKKLEAGSLLEETTPGRNGRFWLFSGAIKTQNAQDYPPVVGESWGYPNTKPLSWSAETDLLLYHLPIKHWELATLVGSDLCRWQEEDGEMGRWGDGEMGKILPRHPLTTSPPHPLTQTLPHPLTPSPPTTYPYSLPPTPHSPLWRRYPFIEQQSSSDCGATCLAMISRYWGKRFSLNTLRNLAQTDRTGACLAALSDAAQNLGYDALPVRASLCKLELHPYPWIAHWQGGIHYVVVWEVKGDRVLIADPALGKQWLSRQEFEESWTEYALLLSPTDRLNAAQDEKISFSGIKQALSPHRQLLKQIFLTATLLSVVGVLTPIFAQIALDYAIPGKNLTTVNAIAVGLFVLGMGRIVLSAVRQHLLDSFSNLIDGSLTGSFISHTLRLPLQFFASRQVGDIISRVRENQNIQVFLTRKILTAASDTLMAVVYLGLMAYYNWQLTFVVLCSILPVAIVTLGASPFLKTVSREFLKKWAEQSSLLVETITGVATVKTTVSEQKFHLRWQERFTDALKARLRGQKLVNVLQLANNAIALFCSTYVLWYGSTSVIGGSMTLGQFVAFNLLIDNAVKPVTAIAKLWDEFQEVIVSVERLNDVLTTQPEENPQKPLQVLPNIRGDVHFENVTFRFNPYEEHNALQNVSFRVKAGQTIAIVGCSGSGKSTLVNLLAGLYRPYTGSILIDGHDTAVVSSQSLRSQLGIVSQECFLFAGTILENITLYSSDWTLDQVITAAKMADADSFIQTLPLGYNSQVGERGMMLSSGQRQKIAIARAFLRNPRILILDEATSFLDAKSEHRFLENLTRYSCASDASIGCDRTTFIIAHRLFTIRHADSILVLDRGFLIEQGTHDELMSIGGIYHNLVQQQLN